MKVRELRDMLASVDPEMIVVVQMGKNELGNGGELRNVEATPAIRWEGDSQWHDAWLADGNVEGTVLNLTSGLGERWYGDA